LSDYVKNHTASACYLRNFADHREKVRLLDKETGRSINRPVEEVGFTRRFWGEDEGIRRRAEEMSSAIESEAAEVLRRVGELWPLRPGPPEECPEWWALTKVFALHIVRSPAWRHWLNRLRRTKIQEVPGLDLSPVARAQLAAHLASDQFFFDTIQRQVPQMATLIGHLNWTLLRFPEPLLVTSDQPVVGVPFLAPNGETPVKFEADRFPARLEFRWPVDPWHAILLTWVDQDFISAPIDLDAPQAIDINVSVKAQATSQVFWKPGTEPPFIRVPERLERSQVISPLVFPDYGMRQAIRSERWRQAHEVFEEMLDTDGPLEISAMRFERVRP
jgi:hypothetical protein